MTDTYTGGLPLEPEENAALAAYEVASAQYEERKRAAWARRVLEKIWGGFVSEDAAEALTREAEVLQKAMRRFEALTSAACGYSTATMAAAVASYYGPAYVLQNEWHADVARMAKVEAKLDSELGRGEVDRLYNETMDARRKAKALAILLHVEKGEA